MKNEFRALGTKILANGKIEGHEVEALKEMLSADGKIEREEAEFLLELYKRTDQITPAFEKYFYQVMKQHLLANGTSGTEQVVWLRKLILADGKVNEREKKLLWEIKGEAKQLSLEAQDLIDDCLDRPSTAK